MTLCFPNSNQTIVGNAPKDISSVEQLQARNECKRKTSTLQRLVLMEQSTLFEPQDIYGSSRQAEDANRHSRAHLLRYHLISCYHCHLTTSIHDEGSIDRKYRFKRLDSSAPKKTSGVAILLRLLHQVEGTKKLFNNIETNK